VEDVRRAFHPFGNVGVPEDMGLFRLAFLPIASEGGHSARIVKSVIYRVYGNVFVQHLLIVQKAAFENDVLIRKGDHIIVPPKNKQIHVGTLVRYLIIPLISKKVKVSLFTIYRRRILDVFTTKKAVAKIDNSLNINL
jgi:hypothetical protein